MTKHLMRRNLRPLYEAATEVHPGLLLQRGFVEYDEQAANKARHIDRICNSTPGDFYQRAYARWKAATDDETRFRAVELRLKTRLFIGLTGGGMLETGCAIAHTHGTPYIPGSSVKGLVAAHARERLADNQALLRELFGASTAGEGEYTNALSGLLAFHDAWWVPDSAERPLVREVVTTHHSGYYGSEGAQPATDFDSPVPNAQVAAQGSFLFVVGGPRDWLELAEQMLVSALVAQGAGAKTRSGYGLFKETNAQSAAEPAATPGREWVNDTIATLSRQHNAQPVEILRGKLLADAWRLIDDPSLTQSAFAEIRSRWVQEDWWDSNPKSKSMRTAWTHYRAYEAESESEQ